MSIYTDDTVKRLRFFNGDIEITKYVIPKSLKRQDYLCTGQLNFGEANSAKAQFKTSEDLQLTGSRILITFGTDEESAPVGKYKITYSSHKANTTEVTITAYDALKEFDKDISQWYNSITWPISLSAFRKSLCEYIGIESVDVTLVNDNIQLYETIAPSSMNGMEMLFYIGQINGVFPHATDDYKLEWVSLGTEAIEIPKSVTYGSKAYEAKSYSTAPIGGVVIRQEDGDIGASVGTTNKYVVQGNVLVYGCSTTELTAISNRLYDKIKDIQYVPCSIKMKYLPDISMGSKCSYDGNIFYVLQRSTSGLLFDTITAGGNEYLESDNGVESRLEQLRGKSNVLDRKIEETKSTISDVEQGLKNEITQTASEFDVKIQSLQSEIDGQIEVINGHGMPELANYPAYNWTAGPKVGDTFIEGLCFTYSDAVYKKHLRTLYFDEDTLTTYRFITKDGLWVWEPLANTEFSVLQKQITHLNVTAQGITGSVEELSTKITNEYITEVDAKSLISLTADGIKEDISKSYSTKDELSTFKTDINKTAEGIEAQISEVNEALDGANEAYITQGKPELYNYPAYNWTAGPKVGDTLTDGLSFTYSDESYRKHNRAIIYDETAGKTYRFVKKDGVWQFSDIGDTEFSFINKKVTELKATADELSASLSKFETKVGSTYITKVEAAASLKVTTDGIYENISKTYVSNDTISGYSTTEQMNTAISKSAEGIALNISKTYATNETVNDLSTVINATAQGLDLKVSTDELITSINASAEMVKISSDKLELEGLVTIESLKSSGATEINGDNIKTGQIKALELIGCTMNGGAISIGGNNIIMNEAGMWVIGDCSAEAPAYKINNRGEISQYWTDGIRRLYSNGLSVSGTMVTHFDEYTSSSNWYQICLAANNSSDKRIKNNIKDIGDDEKRMELLFDKLKPSTFFYNKGSGYIESQKHIGFIAQDIEEAIKAAGFDEDMAVFDHLDEDKLGVNKQELIALLVWQVQKLKTRMLLLENIINGKVETV